MSQARRNVTIRSMASKGQFNGYLFLLLAICAFTPGVASGQWAEAKAAEIHETVTILGQIEKLALRLEKLPLESIRKSVARCIGGTRNPRVLAKLAIITSTLADPQEAGHERVDAYFDEALWECLRRLSKLHDEESSREMAYVDRVLQFDAGGRLQFECLSAIQRGEKCKY